MYVPQLGLAHRLPEPRVAFATAALLMALTAGSLVVSRFLRRPCLNELTLACSVGAFGLSELIFIAIPARPGAAWEATAVWSGLGGSSFAAALFALAAFVPAHRMLRPGNALAVGAAVVIAGLAAVVGGVAAAQSPLSQPGVAANAGGIALELTMTAMYGLAGLGFLRRFQRRHDEIFGWLAIAAILAAAASVNYLLLPASDSDYASLGDVFRLCFLVALLIGAARQMSSHWRTLSAASVLAERQRIAHDLHDGLAQELAYLLRNLQSLDGMVDGETKGQLRGAAERAQAEARAAISALGTSDRQPVNVAIVQAVSEVAARDHIKVELDVVPGIRLPAARAEALTRIACEAVGNAARHSGAEQVRLSLCRRGTRVRLCVSDNGTGFDLGTPSGRFGLACMRDRARSVGGDLRISSEPGRGTRVEATL